MSSGIGFDGGPSRCFAEWQRFMVCYSAKETTEATQCRLPAEDYMECLHHRKETLRANLIGAEFERKLEEKKAGLKPAKKTSLLQDLGLK